jgi:hypothetical protein
MTLTPKGSKHFGDIDYIIAVFAATGLILIYLFFSSWPHVVFGILNGWFAYYTLVYGILVLVTAYKLGMRTPSSKAWTFSVIGIGLFSICAITLVICIVDCYPMDIVRIVQTSPVIRNPSFWTVLYQPFYFMEWVRLPEAKLIGIILVILSLRAIKVVTISFQNPRSS